MSRLLVLLLIIPWMAVQARAAPCLLEAGEPGTVTAVVDGDTLELADGRIVRLVALQAPKLPLGRPGFRAWPLGEESKAALEAMTLGRRLRLSFGGEQVDRYGRQLAHLHDDDGRWIQEEMLRTGMARFYSFPDNRACAAELLAAERGARLAGRGIWNHPFYAVRRHDRADRDIGTFQLVQGTVMSAANVRGRVYLNFGADYRTDFTISISPSDRKSFDAEGFDFPGLEGREIRVRGWIRKRNGALIEVTHPEQIELSEGEAPEQ
jgi:endonuclease YncB( thermonuclease family)